MNSRSGLLQPEKGLRCPYVGGSSPRDDVARSSGDHGGAMPRRGGSVSRDTPLSRIDSTVPDGRLVLDWVEAAPRVRRQPTAGRGVYAPAKQEISGTHGWELARACACPRACSVSCQRWPITASAPQIPLKFGWPLTERLGVRARIIRGCASCVSRVRPSRTAS